MSAHSIMGPDLTEEVLFFMFRAGRESDGKDCLIGPHAWDHGWSYTSERSPLSCRSFPIGGHSVCRIPPPSVAAFACRPASRSSQSRVASLPPSRASAGRISPFHKPAIQFRSTSDAFLLPGRSEEQTSELPSLM